jgi:thiamine kinase-like enzyme
MSLENEIIQVLKNKVSGFANINEQQLELIQEGAYRLRTIPSYFIKWIPNDDQLGQNEIYVNQNILKNVNIPTPRLICTILAAEASIVCWEWLDGIDLRFQHRDWLPLAFAKLGDFHSQQRNNQPVFSLITHRSYNTISELLKIELEFLCSYHDTFVLQKAKNLFSLLELGYPTYIHGDLHPGNIRLIGDDLKFVDWGYCKNSLSLFDLSYIETIRFEGAEFNEWWNITPEESISILPAYYNACGMNGIDYQQIQIAVMLWAKLWSYFNCVKSDKNNDAIICRQHIDQLIAIA